MIKREHHTGGVTELETESKVEIHLYITDETRFICRRSGFNYSTSHPNRRFPCLFM